MSPRDILLQREAATKAVEWVFAQMRRVGDKRIEHVDGRMYAFETYPMPTVVRPRVVQCDDYEWKVEVGTLWARHLDDGTWERAHVSCAANAERVEVWNNLYRNPNEEVEVTP